MDNILVPVDFSQNSLNALDYAIKLAETLQSKLYVVHIAKGGVLPNFMKNANELPIEVAEDKIYKLKKKFRCRLLIRSKKSLNIQNSLSKIITKFKFSTGIKLTVDVDPINFN